MDKRIIKSKQKIYNAFMEIRAKKDLHKITVKEICEKADINKSTFYEHYEDIFDLSDQLETELVLSVVSNIESTDSIILNPAFFTEKLFNALTSEKRLNVLFKDSTRSNLVNKLSVSFKNIILEKYPQLKDNSEFNILLDYATFGGYYAYESNIKSSDKYGDVIKNIIKITDHMNMLIKERTK